MGEASGVSDGAVRAPPSAADEAWSEFLSQQASLILQVVHLFERDPDQVHDCFLFVCERLRRDGLRRVRRYHEEGAASFPTWLRAVVRNLCLDWRRHRDGRFRLPRAIARLSSLDQDVFRSVQLRGLSENEAFHGLRAVFPALTREDLSEAVRRVRRAVDGRWSWRLLLHRPRMQSLSAGPPGSDPAEGEARLVDPDADPERDAARHERLAALHGALGELSPKARLLIRLRYEQELTLEQVAGLTGLTGPAQVERQIHEALESLRARMGAHAPGGVSVKVR